MPKGVEEGIRKGMYLLKASAVKAAKGMNVQLLGSGAILRQVEQAGVWL